MSDNGFIGSRLTETTSELQAVRNKLKTTTEQLNEAKQVLRFYSNVKNYKARRVHERNEVLQDQLEGDYSVADNDSKTLLAGNRARVYLKQYE